MPPGYADGLFQPGVARCAQSAEGQQPPTEASGLETQKRDLKGTLAVDEDHPEQGRKNRNICNGLGVGQVENGFHAGAEGQLLIGKSAAHGVFHVFELLERELGGIEAAGNLGIQVAPNKTTDGDGQHAPEGHAGDVAEFEGGMKRNDQRCCGAQDDVKIKPVAGIPLPGQPSPLFAERVEIDEEEKKHTEHAQLHSDGAAGAQQFVLGRKGTLSSSQTVIVVAVTCDDQNHGGSQQPSKNEPGTMAALALVARECGGSGSGFKCGGAPPGFPPLPPSMVARDPREFWRRGRIRPACAALSPSPLAGISPPHYS